VKEPPEVVLAATRRVRRCPGCLASASLFFRARDTNRNTTAAHFDYCRCQTCGLIFMPDVPEDLAAYYPSDYHHVAPTLHELAMAAERERYKIEIVQATVASGRLLDVGASWGEFAYLAALSGFAVTAIEMDPVCCEYLREVVGVEVTESSNFHAAISEAQPFRVVTMWHVIEHLRDPWSALQAVAAKLDVGGMLVVATPNPRALQFRLLRSRWTHIDAPRHTALIPWTLLVDRLETMGLSLENVTSTDPGSLAYDSFGWSMSLANLSRSGWSRWCLRQLGRAAARALRPIERLPLRGSCYTAVFRRVSQ